MAHERSGREEKKPARDTRADAARYYDLSPREVGDAGFYRSRIEGPGTRVLELGCGTGRVLIPLAQAGATVHGVDISRAMVEICRDRIAEARLTPDRARVSVADITRLEVDEEFDLVIAPFRVLQALATDEEVTGLLEGVRRHLAEGGRAVLNCFRPYLPRERLISEWCSDAEQLDFEVETPEGTRVTCHDLRRRLETDPLVVYPDLIYREYRGAELVGEAVLPISMRCYYPEDLVSLIENHGFRITGRWGGYAGEVYGEGDELVVEFI